MSVPNVLFGSGPFVPPYGMGWILVSKSFFVGVLFCWVFGLWLDISDSPFGVFRESSTESLILAQDERWRRA